MNNRNALGLPENCRSCSKPSCIDVLLELTEMVQVTPVGDELHAYPPDGLRFERQCADAVLQLSVCLNRASLSAITPEVA